METLVIDVPNQKSALVKQLLTELGVTIKSETRQNTKPSDFVGCITKETAEQMLKDVAQSRNEWERDI